ncbi:PA2778 family cysteine peptidase [Halomonas sp. PAMB 3232]|uniref:PA2778 family cysteine peptidase n=1 Tax=Halomonas sp. PAMB 3232 TaxID=3075221 RepID=UPI00289EB487|nr:PA2778 family cysteine peptidase [Halomonas sp. PAMB 3232]WNL37591.1 PA2778 family cysteine peptidase [Halomonas sp. PAMB 3232]
MRRLAHYARTAGVFVLALWLSGCARHPVLLESTYRTITPRVELTDVPFFAQREYQCGPASLAMVLNHQGESVALETLIREVYLPGREGSLQPEMLASVRRHDLIPYVIRPTLDALLHHLNAGEPVVVMQNLALPVYPLWHYAVAIGFDLANERLLLRSGEIERHALAFSRFDATWARSERWGFVVKAPGELPVDVSARGAVDAISAFEALNGASAALPSWQALVERHPESGLAWFALGNAFYSEGEPSSARHAFEAATRADPMLGAAWLNMGLLLALENDMEASQAALRRAAEIAGPWQARAQELLDD